MFASSSLRHQLLITSLVMRILSCLHAHCLNHNHNPSNQTHLSDSEQHHLNNEVQAKLNEIQTNTRANDQKCQQAERDLDRCSAKLIGFGQSGELSLPDSMNDLNNVYCPKFKDTVSCIKNSTQCYKPFERQIINWILSSSRKMNYKRCKNEGEKERFLRLTNSCLVQARGAMDECMSTYIASLEAIANVGEFVEHLTEDDIQIQLSCCANRRFKSCVTQNAKQRCRLSDKLGKLKHRTNSVSSQKVAHKYLQRVILDTMDDLKSTLDGMALTGPEFICNSVEEKFCKAKFDGRYSLNRIPRHKSIVPAMIKIYNNKY